MIIELLIEVFLFIIRLVYVKFFVIVVNRKVVFKISLFFINI